MHKLIKEQTEIWQRKQRYDNAAEQAVVFRAAIHAEDIMAKICCWLISKSKLYQKR